MFKENRILKIEHRKTNIEHRKTNIEPMKIGIFFGGPAREREISFAGGKTAMENIDKTLFEPIPVFVDGCGHFILLNPELVYAAAIRDFYPPKSYQGDYQIYAESLGQMSDNELDTMISEVGNRISPDKFSEYFQFAFIAMHGPACEDGSIQGLLEYSENLSGEILVPTSEIMVSNSLSDIRPNDSE